MMTNQNIYWTLLEHNQWNLYIASTDKGLCYVSGNNQSFQEFMNWKNKHLNKNIIQQNDEKNKNYINQLIEYLDGTRQQFDIPIDVYGTDFQKKVWLTLCQVSYSHLSTYSEVAKKIGSERAVRAVGTAIGANPILIVVPCHRIIGKNGTLTGYRGGLDMKQQLLKLEGTIEYNKNYRLKIKNNI
ncbi:methylated-DNA--[protein]-cysteine S-methyltransferase [Bacillus andreraoultii]|uniref:methylated-DNA--[protein]-cysteine S-methyltransferase n=1 Tax=Bacillus andreraoultii TaxID=1499685 RepID=UPI000539CFCF|nr:methylated-DNA--[protein]-cysteine S-methyltransferase [Bacillus andreraoultii]